MSWNILVILIMTAGYSGYGFSYPISNFYYEELGLSLSEIQLLRGMHTGAYILVLLSHSFLISRISPVTLSRIGAVSAALSAFLYFYLPSRQMCFVAEIFHAIGVGTMMVCIPELIRRESIRIGKAEQIARLIGIAVFIEMISWVAANIVGSRVAAKTVLVNAYGLTLCSFLLCMTAAFLLRNCDNNLPHDSLLSVRMKTSNLWQVIIHNFAVIVAFGIITGGYRALLSLQPSYLRNCGLTLEQVGIICALLYVVVSLAAISAPVISRLGITSQFSIYSALGAIGLLTMGVQTGAMIGPALIIPLACVRGWSRVTVVCHIQNVVPSSTAGSAVSVLFFAERIGTLLFLLLLGAVLQNQTVQYGLLILGIFQLVLFIVILISFEPITNKG